MIVLDSSFLIGFHNPSDAHHRAASVLMERFLAGEWGKGLLLEYVFLEVVTVIMLRLDLAAASRTGRKDTSTRGGGARPLEASIPPAFLRGHNPIRLALSTPVRDCRCRESALCRASPRRRTDAISPPGAGTTRPGR